MKKYFKILFLCVILASCSNSENKNYEDQAVKDIVINVKDIYISGYEYDYSTSKYRAKYWKNGIETYLTDGMKNAKAFCVFVYIEDVYIVGYEENEKGVKIAKYWKNGTGYDLTTYEIGDLDSIPTSVYVANNILYIVGYKGGNNNSQPTVPYLPVLWKDSKITFLPDGYINKPNEGYPAIPKDLFIKDSNIYIVGDTYYDDGIFWKNGTSKILQKENNPAYSRMSLNSIFAYGTDLYIAGTEYWSQGKSGGGIGGGARYWKNEILNSLPSISTYYSNAKSIFVSNNNIYVAGYDVTTQQGLKKAVYWKNSKEVFLPVNGIESSANAIFVNAEDTYIIGYESKGAFEDYIVKFWKNDIPTDLTRGIPTNIFVK
jgi:hypothetical protein